MPSLLIFDVFQRISILTDGSTSLRIDIGWNTSNINNDGTGSYPGQPIRQRADSDAVSDGSYTITSTKPIPMAVVGSGTVAIEGHPAGDYNGDGKYTDRIPVTSAQTFFAITDATPQPRRVVVDVKNCQNCHGHNDGLSLHGGNRTDNVNVCMICHNPNATDINRRPIDPDGTPNGVNTAAVDMLEQRPINFNTLIHSIHGADFRSTDFVVYGFGSSVNNFADVGLSRHLSNCSHANFRNISCSAAEAAGLLVGRRRHACDRGIEWPGRYRGPPWRHLPTARCTRASHRQRRLARDATTTGTRRPTWSRSARRSTSSRR